MNETRNAIEIQNVHKSYYDEEEQATREILKGLSLTIKENEFVCVLGKSGCGKSTLLNLVAGYLKPDEGSILCMGKPVTGPSAERGVVFQEHALFPWCTVKENIAFGLKIKGKSRKEIDETVEYYINMIGLQGSENKYPSSLSGGMAQRVGIARALANEPSVLLCDEPLGALDAITRESMRLEFLKLWEKTSTTILFITHSVPEAVYLADRVILLREGRVAMDQIIDIPRPRNTRSGIYQDYVAMFEQGLNDNGPDNMTMISE